MLRNDKDEKNERLKQVLGKEKLTYFPFTHGEYLVQQRNTGKQNLN